MEKRKRTGIVKAAILLIIFGLGVGSAMVPDIASAALRGGGRAGGAKSAGAKRAGVKKPGVKKSIGNRPGVKKSIANRPGFDGSKTKPGVDRSGVVKSGVVKDLGDRRESIGDRRVFDEDSDNSYKNNDPCYDVKLVPCNHPKAVWTSCGCVKGD